MLHAAVGLLDEHGPDALQTRKVASAAGTSTMAVYTHFGGMRGLIAELADEGYRQFDAALTVAADRRPGGRLVHPRHRIPALRHRAAAHVSADVRQHQRARHQCAGGQRLEADGRRDRAAHPQLRACGARGAAVACGRGGSPLGSAADDATVIATAAQFWALSARVRDARIGRLLRRRRRGRRVGDGLDDIEIFVALGDSPERVAQSRRRPRHAEQTQKPPTRRACGSFVRLFAGST